jgi:DHA1 family bicyclomycin/chloramphenicol resistance-like MFS transporter
MAPLFGLLAAVALLGANGAACSLQLFPERAGAASALLGTAQFIAGAIGAAILSVVSGEEAMSAAVAFFGCLAWAAWRFGVRPAYRALIATGQ